MTTENPASSPNNLGLASHILDTALETVTQLRPGAHGDAENSFHMIAELWDVYVSNVEGRLTGADVAAMMVLLKLARAMHGDASNKDHYVDAAGYAALMGMLNEKGRST